MVQIWTRNDLSICKELKRQNALHFDYACKVAEEPIGPVGKFYGERNQSVYFSGEQEKPVRRHSLSDALLPLQIIDVSSKLQDLPDAVGRVTLMVVSEDFPNGWSDLTMSSFMIDTSVDKKMVGDGS